MDRKMLYNRSPEQCLSVVFLEAILLNHENKQTLFHLTPRPKGWGFPLGRSLLLSTSSGINFPFVGSQAGQRCSHFVSGTFFKNIIFTTYKPFISA